MTLAEQLIENLIEVVAIPAKEWNRLTNNNRGHLEYPANFRSTFPDGKSFKGFMDDIKSEYPDAEKKIKTGSKGLSAFWAQLKS